MLPLTHTANAQKTQTKTSAIRQNESRDQSRDLDERQGKRTSWSRQASKQSLGCPPVHLPVKLGRVRKSTRLQTTGWVRHPQRKHTILEAGRSLRGTHTRGAGATSKQGPPGLAAGRRFFQAPCKDSVRTRREGGKIPGRAVQRILMVAGGRETHRG
jgi:hypothetical protein